MSNRTLNLINIFVVIPLLWGSTFLFTKILLQYFPPVYLAGLRYSLAGILFLIVLYFRFGWAQLSSFFLKNLKGICAIGFSGITVAVFFQNMGLKYTTSSSAAVLNAIEPVLIFILSVILLKEKVQKNQIAGLLTGIFGLILILSEGNIKHLFYGDKSTGDLFILASLTGYAFYTILGKLTLRKAPPLLVVGTSTIFGAITLDILALLVESPPVFSAVPLKIWLFFLYLSTLPTCLAYYLYFHVLSRVEATRANSIIILIPVYGALMGYIFLEEPLNFWFLSGGILVIAGAWLIEFGSSLSRQKNYLPPEK